MSISKKLLGCSGGYFRAISCRNHAGLSLGISALLLLLLTYCFSFLKMLSFWSRCWHCLNCWIFFDKQPRSAIRWNRLQRRRYSRPFSKWFLFKFIVVVIFIFYVLSVMPPLFLISRFQTLSQYSFSLTFLVEYKGAMYVKIE